MAETLQPQARRSKKKKQQLRRTHRMYVCKLQVHATTSTAVINSAQVQEPQVQEAQRRLTPLDETRQSGDELCSMGQNTAEMNPAQVQETQIQAAQRRLTPLDETKHR